MEFRRQEAKAKKVIRKAKRESFRLFCQGLSFSSTSSQAWNFVKSISGQEVHCTLPLSQNGIALVDDLAKAELLAQHFQSIIGVSTSIPNEPALHHFLNSCLGESSSDPINDPFTVGEINVQLNSLKSGKAIGSDLVANEMLVKLPYNILTGLLELFNTSWADGYVPKSWKLQQILPIPKPNLDLTLPSSYRPISLLSCVGKLLEKMVNERLNYWLESRSLLPDYQCGFRKGRSTIDVLLQLEHRVFKSFREKKVSLVIFFDLSKAFDRASHLAVLYRYCKLGLRGNCLRWLKSFFEDRSFQVVVGQSSSSTFAVKKGVPQGSVLSPVDFSVLLCDVPILEGVYVMVLADDITFQVVAPSLIEAQERLQLAVDAFMNWVDSLGFIVNAEKSKLMCFTRKKISFIPEIRVNDVIVPFVNRHCFLGLILDGPSLTWKHHIEYLKISCTKRLDIMKRIASRSWGSDVQSLLIFYKSFVRSKLDYGAVVYGSASRTLLRKLDVIQSSALRIALGAFCSSPILSMQVEANVLPLSYWRDLSLIIWFAKLQRCSLDHPLFQLTSSELSRLHSLNWTSGRNVPAAVRACYMLSRLSLPRGSFSPLPVCSPFPPWVDYSALISVDFPVNKSVSNSDIVSCAFGEMVENKYMDLTQIYTDGSLIASIPSASAGIYVPSLNYSASWKLSSNNIVTAELYGIWMALLFIIKYLGSGGFVVFTDSLASLNVLLSYGVNFRSLTHSILSSLMLLKCRGVTVFLQWLPSHSGIVGNDRADLVARSAHSLERITFFNVPFKELRTSFIKLVWEKWRGDRGVELAVSGLGRVRSENRLGPFVSGLRSRVLNSCILRLRIGHLGLNSHLFRLKLVDSADCSYCGVLEDIVHVFFNCPRYYSSRIKLSHSLRQIGVPFTRERLFGNDIDEPKKHLIFRYLSVFLRSTSLCERL